MRFCDLKLSIQRAPLARHVRRLYADLERRGIEFRPHVWLSEEWFSPDGVPGIAMPFYLAHPRLERLERRIMHEAEGGDPRLLLRILRHEAGHALDNAYRLRRRGRWRQVFGPASLPYPARYRARAGSRRYVHHLGEWYAQAHPTEDFAETFAVWLAPKSAWRKSYARSEEHTSELQSRFDLVCRLLLEKKKIDRSSPSDGALGMYRGCMGVFSLC